ncbi:SIS domain-containing protein [Pluralibacter sp.]|uniref:SIS domain-containing protein n=1 Tax=Pluralibacter sp. TaxID=1920032 RepID=UPI0025F2A538|nr:SIS domain-containing protein [Pluralibacter sp.]MBV8041246.1 SIS domain-containing protein [Pluralibacter sp.]
MGYLNKLKADIRYYTETEKKIAFYIISHLDSFKDCSSKSIAASLKVAQSSISKFSQKLGARGFTELKMLLIEEYTLEVNNKHKKHLHTSIEKSDSLEIIARKLIREKHAAIEETTNNINFNNLREIIKVIHSANHIQITGIGGSALTAKDLAFKLMKIGYRVTCEIDSHVQITVAQALSHSDVQIAISYSGRKREILVAAAAAKERGAKVIAITALAQNQLQKLADYTLETISNEDEWRSSSISSRTAQNCITDLLFVSLLQINDLKSLELIERSRSLISKLE